MDYLRKVTNEDIDLLYQWANDATVRANAFSTDTIPYKNHIKWFGSRMEDPDTAMYILVSNDMSVGQIRLDIEGNEAEIDYSIDVAYRGKGYGQKMLSLLYDTVRESMPQLKTLTAKVKPENQASRQAFLKASFVEKNSNDAIPGTEADMNKKDYISYYKRII